MAAAICTLQSYAFCIDITSAICRICPVTNKGQDHDRPSPVLLHAPYRRSDRRSYRGGSVMGEARFTPGPWRVAHGVMNTIRIEGGYGTRDGTIVYVHTKRTTTKELPGGGTLFTDIPVKDAEANARLIAAAPSLYEALEECVAVLTDEVVGTINHDDPDWYLALDRAVATARAALRLARGEEDGE